jgi:hypothetical protein
LTIASATATRGNSYVTGALLLSARVPMVRSIFDMTKSTAWQNGSLNVFHARQRESLVSF